MSVLDEDGAASRRPGAAWLTGDDSSGCASDAGAVRTLPCAGGPISVEDHNITAARGPMRNLSKCLPRAGGPGVRRRVAAAAQHAPRGLVEVHEGGRRGFWGARRRRRGRRVVRSARWRRLQQRALSADALRAARRHREPESSSGRRGAGLDQRPGQPHRNALQPPLHRPVLSGDHVGPLPQGRARPRAQRGGFRRRLRGGRHGLRRTARRRAGRSGSDGRCTSIRPSTSSGTPTPAGAATAIASGSSTSASGCSSSRADGGIMLGRNL